MEAIRAIFAGGQVQFNGNLPEVEGPVAVMVIFPDLEEVGFRCCGTFWQGLWEDEDGEEPLW